MEANSTAIVWYKEQRQGKPKLTVIVTGEGAESIHELFDLMKPNNRPFIYSQGELYGDPKSMRKVEEYPEEAKSLLLDIDKGELARRIDKLTPSFHSDFAAQQTETMGVLLSDGVEDYGSIAPKKDWVEMLGLREPFGWFVLALGMAGVAWIAVGVFS